MSDDLSREELKAKYSPLADPDNDWREPTPVGDQVDQALSDSPSFSPAASFHWRVRTAVEVVIRGPVAESGLTEEQLDVSNGEFSVGMGSVYHHEDVDRQLKSRYAQTFFHSAAQASLRGPTGVQRIRLYDRDAEVHGKAITEYIVAHPYTHAKAIAAVLNAHARPCFWCYWTPASWEYNKSRYARRLLPKRFRDALLVSVGTTVVALPTCPDCRTALLGEVESDNPNAMGLDFLSDHDPRH